MVKRQLVTVAGRRIRMRAMFANDDKVVCPICGEFVDKGRIVDACGVVDYMCSECFMRVDVDVIGECSA